MSDLAQVKTDLIPPCRITPSRPQKGVIAPSIQSFAEVRQYRFLCKSMNWIAACLTGRISWKVYKRKASCYWFITPMSGWYPASVEGGELDGDVVGGEEGA